MNIRKIIKEELLKEVGGYDDLNVMGQHVGSIMSGLAETHSQLTTVISALANAIMDGQDKNSITQYLKETSEEINIFIDSIKMFISDFTEDDVIVKAKEVISSLKTFKRKIDVLSNFSDAMGNHEQFIKRVKLLLIDLIPKLEEYGEQLNVTNKMFLNRTASSGFGFNPN